MKYTFNPTRQYFYQTVFHRVFNPPTSAEETIPELDANVKNYITPEKKVYENAKDELKKVKEMFNLQEQDIRNEVIKKIYW